MKATTLTLLAWALLGVGCASSGANLTTLKSTYEEFEQRIRWADDVGAAAQMVVPERRSAFITARTRDAKDVSISEIDLLDVHQSEDGQSATVTSRVRWVREEPLGGPGQRLAAGVDGGGPVSGPRTPQIKSAHRPGAGRDGGRRASPHGTPSPAGERATLVPGSYL